MASTLYLDHRGLQLNLQGKALTIHQDGEYQRSIPLTLIERIICNASVTVKTSVLAGLADRGIGISLFGGRKGRVAAHLASAGTLDVERRIGQFRCYLDGTARTAWSVRLIAHKLLRQQRLLKQALQRRPDQRLALFKGIERIGALRKRLSDEAIGSIDTLRGIEGAAARHYFQAFAAILPSVLGFSGRNRRPPKDPVNALLSLGYTLLHGELQQAIASVGLDPWLGLYHEPAHGRASLVCDIQELYRHQIDELTWILTRERILREHHFAGEGGACLLTKEGRAIYYPLYETRMQAQRKRMRRVLLWLAREWQNS
jgi:CRISPR-associated protein Cas1